MQHFRPQHFTLFLLGQCQSAFERRFADRGVEIALSKHVFIDLARKAGVTTRAERTLYRNLEELEARRLLHYTGRMLHLTPKGMRQFRIIKRQVQPYVTLAEVLASHDLLRYARRMQTRLRK